MEQIQAFWNPDQEVLQEDEESKKGQLYLCKTIQPLG